MKKLVIFALTLMFACGEAQATEFSINDQGEVRQEEEGWRPLTELEQEAVNNPGTEVPMTAVGMIEYRRDSLWYFSSIVNYQQVLIYEAGRLQIRYQTGTVETRHFGRHLVLALVAIFMVMAGNVWRIKKEEDFHIFPILGAIFVTFSTFLLASIDAGTPSGLLCLFAFAAIVVSFFSVVLAGDEKTNRAFYWSASGVFYFMLVMVIFAVW
ncbi:MAG: hypothetical protein WDZ85_03910 [Candidatus Paceibacterota bacterium]